jgi:hypothetical protein
MDPAPQQVGVDAVSHRHCGHRDARLLRSSHCLRLELGAVNSPPAAWRCLVHSAYVPIKSLMDTSILGTAQRINMTCQDAYQQMRYLPIGTGALAACATSGSTSRPSKFRGSGSLSAIRDPIAFGRIGQVHAIDIRLAESPDPLA